MDIWKAHRINYVLTKCSSDPSIFHGNWICSKILQRQIKKILWICLTTNFGWFLKGWISFSNTFAISSCIVIARCTSALMLKTLNYSIKICISWGNKSIYWANSKTCFLPGVRRLISNFVMHGHIYNYLIRVNWPVIIAQIFSWFWKVDLGIWEQIWRIWWSRHWWGLLNHFWILWWTVFHCWS